jgi:serine/threonine-protein kinase/endoribonuclease IRE1
VSDVAHGPLVCFSVQEADSQFRYIALELCFATVQDLILGKTQYTYKMDAIDILFQAMSGIAHLHSLDIGKGSNSNSQVLLKILNY